MNTKLEIFLSAFTAFAIVGGGSIVTIVSSQPGGTGSLNKTAWIMSAALGLIAAAKDVRALLKLPPATVAAALRATAKTVPIIAIALLLCGCNTAKQLITPAALTSEVSIGIRVGLDVYPQAAPEVAMARDVICWAAASTNASPDAIVAWLQGVGITNSNSKLIVDGGLLLYQGIYDLIGTNNTTAAQPYLNALCAGFTAGLPPAAFTATESKRQKLPAHLQ